MSTDAPLPKAPGEGVDPEDVSRSGAVLLKFQFVVFSALLVMLLPASFIRGEGAFPSFYWAALVMHAVFVGWLALSERGHARTALVFPILALVPSWGAYLLSHTLDWSPWVTGAVLFVMTGILAIAWAHGGFSRSDAD